MSRVAFLMAHRQREHTDEHLGTTPTLFNREGRSLKTNVTKIADTQNTHTATLHSSINTRDTPQHSTPTDE